MEGFTFVAMLGNTPLILQVSGEMELPDSPQFSIILYMCVQKVLSMLAGDDFTLIVFAIDLSGNQMTSSLSYFSVWKILECVPGGLKLSAHYLPQVIHCNVQNYLIAKVNQFV